MKKLIVSAVMACGLLLLDSPEAAAHEEKYKPHRGQAYQQPYRRDSHKRDYYRQYKSQDRYRDYYHHDYKRSRYDRARKMPRWLKRDRSFRHWYEHTRLRKDRRLSWGQLFEIYRWEHYRYRYRIY